MGLFDFFKKKKTDIEQYQQELDFRRAAQSNTGILLQVEDTFSVTGRGTVVVGKCLLGFCVGDRIFVQAPGGIRKEATVSGLEKFRSKITSAAPGDHVGVLLEGVTKNDVPKGALLKQK